MGLINYSEGIKTIGLEDSIAKIILILMWN